MSNIECLVRTVAIFSSDKGGGMNTTTSLDMPQSLMNTSKLCAPNAIIGGKRYVAWQASPEKTLQPLSWHKPRHVELLTELFHHNVTDEMRDRIFAVMAMCPQHTFQVLTKRPEAMLAYFKGHGDSHRRNIAVYNAAVQICAGDFSRMSQQMGRHRSSGEGWWPLANFCLGVSVEDQKTADARIPLLLRAPAAIHYLSYEPALGSIDFSQHLQQKTIAIQISDDMAEILGEERIQAHVDALQRQVNIDGPYNLDWVIVGGESGPGARPFNVDWARQTVKQCREAGTACFVKQMGAKPIVAAARINHHDWGEGKFTHWQNEKSNLWLIKLRDRKGGDMSEWPEDLRVREMPKEVS